MTFAEAGTHGLGTAGAVICSPWWIEDEERATERREGSEEGKKKEAAVDAEVSVSRGAEGSEKLWWWWWWRCVCALGGK